MERKLRRPRHFSKSVGREVIVKTTDGTKLRGTLVAATDDAFQVEVNGVEHGIRYEAVATARTVFTMPAKAKPGKQKKEAAAGKQSQSDSKKSRAAAESLTGKSK